MNRFHWILIVIEIDCGEITVMDPKQYPTSMYPELVDALHLVWARFVKKISGTIQGRLLLARQI
jgi:hypothetical protein